MDSVKKKSHINAGCPKSFLHPFIIIFTFFAHRKGMGTERLKNHFNHDSGPVLQICLHPNKFVYSVITTSMLTSSNVMRAEW